jgi:hypothetical protein
MWLRAWMWLDWAYCTFVTTRKTTPRRGDFAWAIKKFNLSPEEFEEWATGKAFAPYVIHEGVEVKAEFS